VSMKKSLLLFAVEILLAEPVFAKSEDCDGTPDYRFSVGDGYRNLQYRTSIYGHLPPQGAGIRLGIYQVQAA